MRFFPKKLEAYASFQVDRGIITEQLNHNIFKLGSVYLSNQEILSRSIKLLTKRDHLTKKVLKYNLGILSQLVTPLENHLVETYLSSMAISYFQLALISPIDQQKRLLILAQDAFQDIFKAEETLNHQWAKQHFLLLKVALGQWSEVAKLLKIYYPYQVNNLTLELIKIGRYATRSERLAIPI